jgi:hypothetical protein
VDEVTNAGGCSPSFHVTLKQRGTQKMLAMLWIQLDPPQEKQQRLPWHRHRVLDVAAPAPDEFLYLRKGNVICLWVCSFFLF